ncbi:MAG TPA: hypothetical protein VE967_04385 [Gemmatimonadaceae bacterium]|nr:hypothetical protein [Gemmatimonadaceae bacterium]
MAHNTDPHREPEAPAAHASGSLQPDTPETAVPVMPAPESVHRWLDGEQIPPAELGTADAEKHVRFWAKVNQETERRHRVHTPRGLDAIIMEKLDAPVVKDD